MSLTGWVFRRETKQRNSVFPHWRNPPPPVLTGPLWWPQPLLEVELWPSIGQETKLPTAPLRRGPSHLQGIISKPPTWILCFSDTLKIEQEPHQAAPQLLFIPADEEKERILFSKRTSRPPPEIPTNPLPGVRASRPGTSNYVPESSASTATSPEADFRPSSVSLFPERILER